MAAPVITIGILNWNGLNYLKQTLNKIINLHYLNKEIIVFDNGSTDGSIGFLSKIKEIKLIKSSENLGYSKAKNIIVNSAKGKYILLLDDDIMIHQENLISELLCLYLKEKPGFISILLINKGEKNTAYIGGFWNFAGYTHWKKSSLKKIISSDEDFHYCQAPEGGAIFFEKSHFRNIGGFDETQPYYCDVGDIGIRSYILTGKKNIVTHKIYFYHLGIKRKKDLNRWLFNLEYIIIGTFKVLLYNFSTFNVIRYSFSILFFGHLGVLYKCIEYKSVKPVLIYLKSLFLVSKELPEILKIRKRVQNSRKIVKDDFLNIRRYKE